MLRDAERQSRLVEHIRLDQNLRAFHHRLQAAVARARQTMRQAVEQALGAVSDVAAQARDGLAAAVGPLGGQGLLEALEGALAQRLGLGGGGAGEVADGDDVLEVKAREGAGEAALDVADGGAQGDVLGQRDRHGAREGGQRAVGEGVGAGADARLARDGGGEVGGGGLDEQDVVEVASLTGGLGTDLEAAHGDEADEDLRELHVEALERVDAEAEAVSDALREADATFDRLEAAVIERTRVESLTGAPEEIERFVRQKESELARSRAARAVARIKRGMRQGLARLVYERSRGLLLARRLTRPDGESGAVERVLRLASACEPDPEVEQNLSVHYSQLFSGGHAAYRAYRVSRDAEMAAADAAVARREAGRAWRSSLARWALARRGWSKRWRP